MDKENDFGIPSTPGMFGEEPDPNELTWYSYVSYGGKQNGVHTGALHTKRYLDWMTYKEAGDSDFTCYVTRVYSAPNRTAAVTEGLRLVKVLMGHSS